MYLDVRMKVPSIPGRIIQKRIAGTTYVYFEYGRTYDPQRQFSIPKRTTIGKLDDEGLMIPNENFRKFLPWVRLPGDNFRSNRSGCLKIGAWFIIRKIVEDYKLPEMLSNFFNDRDVDLFLDLMTYLLITENNLGHYFTDYVYNHPLFTKNAFVCNDSTVSDFLDSITDEHAIGFLNSWNKNRNQDDRIYLSYGSADKDCQAGDLDIVDFGKAKEDRQFPIFNYSIGYDRNNRVPLFYEEYPGSVVDASQLQFMLEKAKGYGYRKVGFILDRGCFSKSSLAYMDDSGCDFILMVKGMKPMVNELVLANKGTFETSRECAIRECKVYGKTVKRRLHADDTQDRYFHIYHSSGKEHAEREAVETKIDRFKKYLKKNEGGIISGTDSMEFYFDLFFDKKKKVVLFAKEKVEVIEKELNLCGYFVIVTSEQMTAQEALLLYESRDNSEKLFRSGKSYLGSKSVEVCPDESASGKIFIEFMALIVRNRLHTNLKSAKQTNEKRRNYMTAPAAIQELEKIEMVRGTDDIYRLDHAITDVQRNILSALGLGTDYVIECADRLSEQLKQCNAETQDN